MDYRIGVKQVIHSYNEEVENKLWDKWLTIYPNMSKDNFISFDEFKEQHKPEKRIDENHKEKLRRKLGLLKGGE